MKNDDNKLEEFSSHQGFLEHYGVPGMKWGIRKERETTGRRTSAKRVSKVQNRLSLLNQRKERKAQQQMEKEKKAAEKQARREAQKRQDILNSPTRLYKHRRDYSQEEINNALRQFEWERKLKEYSKAEIKAGKEFIDNLFQYTNSAINLYNSSARIVNSFDLSEKPWKYIETVKPDSQKKKES